MPRISKDQLLKLQKRYPTDASVGALFGIPRQQIHRLRIKYGIAPVSKRNEKRNQEIARLSKSGLAIAQISKQYRISTVHIYRIIKQVQKENFPEVSTDYST